MPESPGPEEGPALLKWLRGLDVTLHGDIGTEGSRRARQRQTNADSRIDITARVIIGAVSNPRRINEHGGTSANDSGRPPVLRFDGCVPEPPPHLLDAKAAVIHQRVRAKQRLARLPGVSAEPEERRQSRAAGGGAAAGEIDAAGTRRRRGSGNIHADA